MAKPANDKPVKRKMIITPYRVMWSTSGLVALVYLGVALFAPGWLGDLTPSAAERERDDTQPQIARLAGEISGLRASLTRLQLDYDSNRAEAATQDAAVKSLDSRIAALEDKARGVQAPVADATPPAPNAPAPAAESADASAGAAPTVINPGATPGSELVTGSIDGVGAAAPAPAPKKSASTPITFGPAVVKPAAKPVGIQIATDATVNGLRLSWTELTARHPDQLKKFGARYTQTGDADKPNYNLVLGPVKNKADAKKLCKELGEHDVLCKVTEFKGDEL